LLADWIDNIVASLIHGGFWGDLLADVLPVPEMGERAKVLPVCRFLIPFQIFLSGISGQTFGLARFLLIEGCRFFFREGECHEVCERDYQAFQAG
jgi:hypothetical protein